MSAQLNDHDSGYTPAEERKMEIEERAQVNGMLTSSSWWHDRMEGVNGLSSEVPSQLARCMSNLDLACKGERIAIDGILHALSILQRTAKIDAEPDAREEAKRLLEAGEL